MKRLFVLMIIFVLCASRSFAENQHQLFTDVLNGNVREGTVDYKSLCKDIRFDQYIDQLMKMNPETLGGKKETLAFWINAYNAWTLKIICDNYPVKSINDLHSGGLAIGMILKKTVWDKKIVFINNEKMSLSDIEHKIIRPVFKDPRIHFALVCAAKGCPPLRAEAYEAVRLNAQLDEQGRNFLQQKDKNSFDVDKKAAWISPIFSWFKKDFHIEGKTVLEYLAQFLDVATAESIKADPNVWRIKYTNYDWSLNEQ